MMRETIQRLLQSELSSNYISIMTGVSQSVISRIRSGERQLGNLSLDSAEKLFEYQKGLDEANGVKSKIVQVENPNNIADYESLVRYYTDINYYDDIYDVEYAELAKVEHDNGNEYYTVELNTVREIPFKDEIIETVDLENLFARFENEDQRGETATEIIYFHTIKDAKDYIEVVLEGIEDFEECAKKNGIIE
ncbi:hypothetical protein [Staphylococcus chromogenes]|uniref:hypothetical protein n=1 Tax=Staphylococcus chromogenes TaxID=46126 RepID=UPI0018F8870F|nr:hypothetical protein [Staphylococcus chromogenes]